MMAKVYWYRFAGGPGVRNLECKWVPVDKPVTTIGEARRLLSSVGASAGEVIYGDCSFLFEPGGRVTRRTVKSLKRGEYKW